MGVRGVGRVSKLSSIRCAHRRLNICYTYEFWLRLDACKHARTRRSNLRYRPSTDTNSKKPDTQSLVSIMAGAAALEIALQLSAGDAFGCSTALLGDHLVIGACGDSGAGAVYSIRVRSLTAPPPFEVLEVVRAADGGSAGAEFGASVFVTETHLLVGAPSHATDPLLPAQRYGAAFLWPLSLDATGARRVGIPRRILSNSPRNGVHFGASVAIAGNRMIIGESGTDIYPAGVPTPEDNGYVYVFHLVSGALLKKLSPVNPTSGELAIGCYGFGASLALSTRRGQLAVGSPKARVPCAP